MASGQYFEAEPGVRSRPGTALLSLPDFRAEMLVDRGVFARTGVDAGTEALLRRTWPPPSGHLLDLGCGYGPIACVLAHRAPGATVWAVDVNRRAVALAAANARSLGLANVVATTPDGVPGGLELGGLWSNPPVRAGKAALHELLSTWLRRLAPEAAAWLVVHKHLGGDSLAAWLAAGGWRVRREASKRGYRVLAVSPASSGTEPAGGGSPRPPPPGGHPGPLAAQRRVRRL